MSVIGSFFGRLFGGSKSAEKALDMVKDGVDALVLTEEEKVNYSIKGVELYLEYLRVTYDGGHLARRLIGLIVTGIWSVYCIAALYFMDMKIITAISDPFMAVMVFYFGAGIVSKLGNMANKNENS
jgi:hypothetical protein